MLKLEADEREVFAGSASFCTCILPDCEKQGRKSEMGDQERSESCSGKVFLIYYLSEPDEVILLRRRAFRSRVSRTAHIRTDEAEASVRVPYGLIVFGRRCSHFLFINSC